DWFASGGSSAATIVNDRLTSNRYRYCLYGRRTVGIGHVESDREGPLCREGGRVTGTSSRRWGPSAPPCNRVRRSTPGWRRSACFRLTSNSRPTTTIVHYRLCSDCDGDCLDCELVVGIRNVQSYAKSTLCSESCRIASARASRRATSATPSNRVRSSSSRWRRSTSNGLACSCNSTATIIDNW